MESVVSFGVARVDELGRVYIPESVRALMGWTEEQALTVTLDPEGCHVVVRAAEEEERLR